MHLYLLRHADAEEIRAGGDDAARALTDKGRRQAQRAAQWLADTGARVALVVTSPRVRARQTAEPVAAALEADLREDPRLGGGFGPADLQSLWRSLGAPESLLLVGHEPDFSLLIEQLTGGAVMMKKAAVALLEGEGPAPGRMALAWLVPSRLQG